MKSTFSILVLFLGASIISNSHIHGQQQTGCITGRVINRTAEEKAVPDHTVVLRLMSGEQEIDAQTVTARTNSQGEFHFTGLDTSAYIGYLLTAEYQEVQYTQGIFTFEDEATEKEVILSVFDSTSQATHILVDQHHILVEPFGDSLFFQEFLRVLNVGRKTYIGVPTDSSGKRETLQFSHPHNASELRFLGGLAEESITFHKESFVDSEPLQPGSRQILFSYTLPFEQGSTEYRSVLFYYHEEMDLFIASPRIQVSTADLDHTGVVGEADTRYIRYSGLDLDAGREIIIQMTKTSSTGRSSVWLVIGALIALLLISGRLIVLRKRRQPSPGSSIEDEKRNQEKLHLIEAIAELDDQYEKGEIESEEYSRERERLKGTLSDIMTGMIEK